MLNLVTWYRHRGTHFEITGSLMRETIHRSSSALNAYAPLAVRIFGSPVIFVPAKLHLLDSLVMSRLVFNAGTWDHDINVLRRLNSVYMRALRRIADEISYEGRSELNDLQVRRKLGVPSIDCLVQRARLKYAARLETTRPRALVAVLRQRMNGDAYLGAADQSGHGWPI